MPEKSLYISCNADQLNQALLAMLINAVESMSSGGLLSVELGRSEDGKFMEIMISDTGSGIQKENIPHIFEPFFTTKKDGKGVGLGLAVAYGIIQQHNGDIKVSSGVNQGTTFTIVLPVDTAPKAQLEEIPLD